jgi:hypothetical protein
MKQKGPDVFVSPHPKGGWQVKMAGSLRAYRRTKTQAEAIAIARPMAARNNSELFIKSKDGKIRKKDSHGHDPRNIPG